MRLEILELLTISHPPSEFQIHHLQYGPNQSTVDLVKIFYMSVEIPQQPQSDKSALHRNAEMSILFQGFNQIQRRP